MPGERGSAPQGKSASPLPLVFGSGYCNIGKEEGKVKGILQGLWKRDMP